MSCSGDCLKLSRAVKLIAHGAIGAAKAILGVDPAPAEIMNQRRGICRSCEYAEPCKFTPANRCMCSKCGCVLRLKCAVAGESCPLGKWQAHPANNEQGAK